MMPDGVKDALEVLVWGIVAFIFLAAVNYLP